MIIGIMGGRAVSRRMIAEQVQAAFSAAKVIDNAHPVRRNQSPGAVVARRVKNMETILSGRAVARDEVLVIPHLLVREEVDVLRQRSDVFIWNAYGPVSDLIPLQRGDLMVVSRSRGDVPGHYLMPDEALSECRRRIGL